MSKPYSITLFGSHPNCDNDDAFTGADFDTRAEVLAAFHSLWSHFNKEYYCSDTAFIAVDGPDICKLEPNPEFKPRKASDDDWTREQAMQAGMGLGIDAYNDAMEG